MLYPDRASSGPYTASAHGNSTTGVDRSSIDTKYSTFSKGNCAHCHEQHASLDGSEPIPYADTGGYGHAGPDPALLFSEEEGVCETCHDGIPVSRDVKTQRLKTYHHPIAEYSGLHTMSKMEYGLSGAPFRGANRHAECADCHEPHYIGYPGTTYHTYNATDPANNNLVSNPVKGVWGVEPDTYPLWTANKTFTELKTVAVGSSKEYQICFKCHSYYALQDSDGVTTIVGPSGDYITDQAMEFSPGNKSAHPVQVTLTNQTGSSSPRSLVSVQMSSPWTNVGNQTMWCCDCHGNDATSPVGPHGSDKKFMLKGTGQYWPANSAGTLWTLGDAWNNTNNFDAQCVCKNCHPIKSGTAWLNNAHSGDPGKLSETRHNAKLCINCHIAVPHGSKRSRLIGYTTDPAPYDYNDNTLKVTGVRKPTTGPTSYTKSSCSTVSEAQGCHPSDWASGTYEP